MAIEFDKKAVVQVGAALPVGVERELDSPLQSAVFAGAKPIGATWRNRDGDEVLAVFDRDAIRSFQGNPGVINFSRLSAETPERGGLSGVRHMDASEGLELAMLMKSRPSDSLPTIAMVTGRGIERFLGDLPID